MLAEDTKAAAIGDLRASFMILHELVLLQKLVETIKATWGPPAQWSCEQYQELVQSIGLAQERSGTPLVESNAILAEAFQLRYRFEEVAENEPKLRRIQEAQQATSDANVLGTSDVTTRETSRSVILPPAPPRLRCPTIYGYYLTFEQLSVRTDSESSLRESTDSRASSSATPLTPRSATIAKYAHLYLEDDVRTRKPWSWSRSDGDDLIADDSDDSAFDSRPRLLRVVEQLCDRFARDRIYTYVSDHTMVLLNPHRILQTSKFTSIYDEQVVLTYAMTPNAQSQLAPHPFAMAKHALLRLFYAKERPRPSSGEPLDLQTLPMQTMRLSGESGSGKTELAKELLKYYVLSAQPTALTSHGARARVKLFTSSTKSTTQMRTEETRTMTLLEAKGVDQYEIVLLDLYPERWSEMTSVSKSKRIPQVHIDGRFFGFYEKLESLEDEEQLRMYFKNPHAARKLSTVLDSNILLEAFGNASTTMNRNSSRFGKVTTLFFAFGPHPSEYQVAGCRLDPFLLEKSRVTSASSGAGGDADTNFHVFYALVAGVNAVPYMRLLAKDLRLDGRTSETFAFLGKRKHKLQGAWTEDETWKKDVERWQHVVDALSGMDLAADAQRAVFQVLSAILWLGNVAFEWDAAAKKLEMASQADESAVDNIVELLGLESAARLESLLFTKRIALASTGESFDVVLEKGQVAHLRDTFARLLYQIVFYYLVAQMNEATQVESALLEGRAGDSLRALQLVDVFGFENFARNSLEQLCINYLSEKLFAVEEQIVAARHSHTRTVGAPIAADSDVLFLFEHPLGIFASLEELTVLHQSENETAEQEQKKNQLLVRNLYERNASRLLEAPRAGATGSLLSKDALPFMVPHAREPVVYDACEFVKKNSDFQHARLIEGLELSTHAPLRAMVTTAKRAFSATATLKKPRDAPGASGRSQVSQFRAQIQALTAHESESGAMPLYMHCMRPNSTGRPTVIEPEVVEKQLHSHRVLAQIELGQATRGDSPTASYYAMEMPSSVFLSRYRCLLSSRLGFAKNAIVYDEDIRACVQELLQPSTASSGEHEERAEAPGGVVVTSNATVRFQSAEMVERLDLLLQVRQIQAAVAIQSFARMLAHRRAFVAKQTERTSLKNELLAIYGADAVGKVDKILSKYQSRESELRAKVALKKQALRREHVEIEQLAQDLQSLCLASDGGLRADTVSELLSDAGICLQLQENESIVSALRDMSLDPQVLLAQLANPVLRAFYQNLVTVLKEKKQAPPAQEVCPELPLEDRVASLVANNREQWRAAASASEWSDHRDTLEEIGDEPELLVFHAEDPEFVAVLETFVARLEAQLARDEERAAVAARLQEEQAIVARARAAEVETELLEMLRGVELDERLMVAMRQDAFFVEALANPVLIASMQQVRGALLCFAYVSREGRKARSSRSRAALALSLCTRSRQPVCSESTRLCVSWRASGPCRPRALPPAHQALVYVSVLGSSLMQELPKRTTMTCLSACVDGAGKRLT